MLKQGYIEIDGKPVLVTLLETQYCHGAPVTYIVTDNINIYETHEPLMPDQSPWYGGFVPQSE